MEQETYRDTVPNRKKPIVSIVLTAINIIVFLFCTTTGEILYNKGSLSLVKVLGDGEYYRIFTCMFLHAGIEHLVSNLLILYFLGEILERAIGSAQYTILYFGAGIFSGIASMGYEYLSQTVIFSVGASGAIYGIIGAMLFLVILNKGRYQDITLRRMLFAIVYMLYSGLKSVNVNNAAHIGGLCCGFFIAFVLYSIKKIK